MVEDNEPAVETDLPLMPPTDVESFGLDDELVLTILLRVLSRVEVLAETSGDTETLLDAARLYIEIYDRLRFGAAAEAELEEGELDDESES